MLACLATDFKFELERLHSTMTVKDMWYLHWNDQLSALDLGSKKVRNFYRDLVPQPRKPPAHLGTSVISRENFRHLHWSHSLSALGLESKSISKFYRELIPRPESIKSAWEKYRFDCANGLN